MIAELRARAWQIGAAAAFVSLVSVSTFLVAARIENRKVTELNRVLDRRITDPDTGYVVRLAQATQNSLTLQTTLRNQVDRLTAEAERSAAKLAETERRLAVAQGETAAVRREVTRLMANPPQGDTLDERVRDVDARVLENLG